VTLDHDREPAMRIFGLLAVCLLLVSQAQAAEAPRPLDPQPAADALKPGLAVRYYYNLFRYVDEIVEWKAYKDGKEGPPLPLLDSQAGAGLVLTSEADDGVGAEITGLIRFDQPGAWVFTANSNDGVRVEIGGMQILEDPDVHADRYSEFAEVTIEQPGWYPITVLYFERKNTSTLQLFWQSPGGQGTMPVVPAEAFAHLETQ